MSAPPARFIGVVLVAPVLAAVAGFYSDLFGWQIDGDGSARDGDVLTAHMWETKAAVRGWLPLVELPEGRLHGVKTSAGGTVAGLDIVALDDPFGATVLVSASASDGRVLDQATRRHGHCSWAQLNTSDPEGSARHYRELFGWSVAGSDNDRYTYWRFLRDGATHGGMMRIDDRSGPGVSPTWQVYFHASDVEAAAQRCDDAKGRIVVGPTRIVGGEFAVVEDPCGNLFGIDYMRHDQIV